MPKRFKKKAAKKKPHPKLATEIPLKIQTNLEFITFKIFLQCICENKYFGLVISGIPTSTELYLAWIKVLSEYYVMIKSKEQIKYIKNVARLESINLKISMVTALVESIRLWYDPDKCQILKEWGYTALTFSEDTVLDDLDRVLVFLGNDRFKLEKARLDYESEQQRKKAKKEMPLKEGYMKTLYAIEKHRAPARYPVDKLSVYEFCMFYNELSEYNEAVNQQNKSLRDKLPQNKKRGF